MDAVLNAILSYLIGIIANLHSNEILTSKKELRRVLENESALRRRLSTSGSLDAELRISCMALARERYRQGVPSREQYLWRLLGDDRFQSDLVEWLRAGGTSEGDVAKTRLLQAMELAAVQGGAGPEHIAFLRNEYFSALEETIFSNQELAHWLQRQSLEHLQEQVTDLRQRAEESAGVYSPERQQAALERYCEKALAVWDILDLSSLPGCDVQLATQALLLRQLYVPLRIRGIFSGDNDLSDEELRHQEMEREARRQGAGYDPASVSERKEWRASVGERLGVSHRLVVLGDPGGGKTTMLRWMATAYLLRQRGDTTFAQLPDIETLPQRDWVPVLIRCRDLGDADLCRSFTDFLTQHLNKTELKPEDAAVMCAVILERIAKGEALILVDGLDEISNLRVRVQFCQELERTAARYPEAPVVVTSRIVGYRDMPYRMGSGFEHGQIADLDQKDKDRFAERWVEVTEQHWPKAERAERIRELCDALHSSDRIERLTGNPMLLTTLALVKRKVGKLPRRRNKLYAEAVSVLLNWNSYQYDTIEEEEAIPQLEYLAYEMCQRGIQRITEEELLDLLERVRRDYPYVRALHRRKPEAFLQLLEARSSLLLKSGNIWETKRARETPVWEFRHLTFQEYLAACALLHGRYCDRDQSLSLAEQVALLARPLQHNESGAMEVPESWREVLRLLVAACRDDDVDRVVRAILVPTNDEKSEGAILPRARLAALCVADGPNVSEVCAWEVLTKFLGTSTENIRPNWLHRRRGMLRREDFDFIFSFCNRIEQHDQVLLLEALESNGVGLVCRHIDGEVTSIILEFLPELAGEVIEELAALWGLVQGQEHEARAAFVYSSPFPAMFRPLLSQFVCKTEKRLLYWRYGFCFFDVDNNAVARLEEVRDHDGHGGTLCIATRGHGAVQLLNSLLTQVSELCERMQWGGSVSLVQPHSSGEKRFVLDVCPTPPHLLVTPEIYVSYAWRQEWEAPLVEELCAKLEERGLRVRRDVEQMSPGDRISHFMQRLSTGRCVVVVLSDAYLRSENCMTELYTLYTNARQSDAEFLKRIVPLVQPGAEIGSIEGRIGYAVHWRRRHAELSALVEKHGPGVLGEEDFARFKLIGGFYAQIGDILAYANDKLVPRDRPALSSEGVEMIAGLIEQALERP